MDLLKKEVKESLLLEKMYLSQVHLEEDGYEKYYFSNIAKYVHNVYKVTRIHWKERRLKLHRILYSNIPIQKVIKKYSGSEISEYEVLEEDLQNHDRFLLSKSSPGGFVAEEDGALVYLRGKYSKQNNYQELRTVSCRMPGSRWLLISGKSISKLEQKYPYTINAAYFNARLTQ